MADEIIINTKVQIPRSELRFKFARSGGPGGQNVNKVETRVELLFDVAHSQSFSEGDREILLVELESKIDKEGILHVIAQESRSQWKNREIVLDRFIELMKKALKPKKKRIATKIHGAAKERRLQNKKRRSEIKKLRGIRHE